MATTYALTCKKGERVTLEGSPPVTGTSISGWTLNAVCRKAYSDAAPLFTLTTTPSSNGVITITDAANGLFTIDLYAACTQTTMGSGTFYLEVWRTDDPEEYDLVTFIITVRGSARTGA